MYKGPVISKALYLQISVLQETHLNRNTHLSAIRAVVGQRSSPDLCFATKSIKIYDLDLKITHLGRGGTA